MLLVQPDALAETARQTFAAEYTYQQVLFSFHKTVGCVLGGACFDALPPAVKQLVCVFPHHLAIYAETLVPDVCLETFSIDYLVENRVFNGHRSQQDYGLRGGKVGIRGKS